MPIRRYVKNGVVFTPQALSSMSRALEATTRLLQSAATRQSVEPSRGSLSGWHEKMTASTRPPCIEKAVAAFGGIAYSRPLPGSLSPRIPRKQRIGSKAVEFFMRAEARHALAV